MLRLLLRLAVMTGTVLAGYALGGITGAIIGACLAMIVITQTEDVIRIFRRCAVAGGSALQITGRALRVFFGHTIVRRLARAFTIALFVGAATAIGGAIGRQVGGVVGAALAVALAQVFWPGAHVTGAHAAQVSTEPPAKV